MSKLKRKNLDQFYFESHAKKARPASNVLLEQILSIETKLEKNESTNEDLKLAVSTNTKAINGVNYKMEKILSKMSNFIEKTKKKSRRKIT